MPRSSTFAVIAPRSYGDAKAVGDALRTGHPVLLVLSEMDAADAYRLVDFASGLVFGLKGDIDRVSPDVLLLVPEGVHVVDDLDQTTGSFYNQS